MKKPTLLLTALLILSLTACSDGAQSHVSSAGAETASAVAASPSDESSPSPSHVQADMSASEDGVIDIGEKMFVTQTNEIYLNYEDYLGKTFRYEGLFLSSYFEQTDITYCYVIRYGPGCCSYDATAGFEIAWDGDYPAENDWVQVVGTLETYDEDGYEYLQLRVSSLEVLDVRGSETVTQ